MPDIDKYETCQNCPDRSINPPCHDTCEGYLARKNKFKQIQEARANAQKENEYFVEQARKRMKRIEPDKTRRNKLYRGKW